MSRLVSHGSLENWGMQTADNGETAQEGQTKLVPDRAHDRYGDGRQLDQEFSIHWLPEGVCHLFVFSKPNHCLGIR